MRRKCYLTCLQMSYDPFYYENPGTHVFSNTHPLLTNAGLTQVAGSDGNFITDPGDRVIYDSVL